MANEYYKRAKKIWKSELSAHNKHVAHNAFAVPLLIPTFGLLNWTITRNFHQNSAIDRLYLQCKNGDRGLKCIKRAYEEKIVAARRHLLSQRNKNKYLVCAISLSFLQVRILMTMKTGNQPLLIEHMSEKC